MSYRRSDTHNYPDSSHDRSGRTSSCSQGEPSSLRSSREKGINRPSFRERFRSFSPRTRQSGDEILKDLKEQLRRDREMFFDAAPDWGFSPKAFSMADDGDDATRRYMDEFRGRGQPSFRMPSWMSDDDDMSELTHRMSHAPHFATFRRGAPFRERRSSGGSAMSATSEDDSCDVSNADKASQCSGGSSSSTGEAHQIPIRIEAEAPPAKDPVPPSPGPVLHDPTEPIPCPPPASLDPHFARIGQPRKMPQYATRTTSAVEGGSAAEVPRDARCASAPPDMAPQSPRFVSKINITPQQSPRPAPFSPLTSNSVPKPWVPNHHYTNGTHQAHVPQKQQHKSHHQEPPQPHQYPIQEEEQQQLCQAQEQPQQEQPQHHAHHQQQQQQQQQHYPQQQQYPQQHYQQQEPQQQYHQQQFVPPSSSPPQWGSSPGGGGRSQQKSVVRNIPIFVEGRDSPIVNEDTVDAPVPQQPGQYHQHQPQQQQQQHQQQPQHHQQQPQQHPHFAPQQQQWRQHFPQHPHHLKQQFRSQSQPHVHSQFFHGQPQPQPQPQHPKPEPQPQPQPQPQAQPQPQPQTQQQPQPVPQQQAQQPPQPQAAVDPRIATIEAVAESVKEYRARAEAFNGSKKEKEFLFLDEMLTRALLKLDNIDPDGKEDVRQARRNQIKEINATISMLEAKVQKQEPAEVISNSTPQETAVEAMETDGTAEERPQETTEEPEAKEASTTKASEDAQPTQDQTNSQETTEASSKGGEAAAATETTTTATAAAAATGGEGENVTEAKTEEEKMKTEAS